MARELVTRAYKPQTNETILAGIRKTASDQYRDRIPPATQANIESTMRNLDQYKPQWNEFIDGLMNLIGDIVYRHNVWTNPLAIFKGPMLQYGDTIEEVGTGLIKAHVYDPNDEYLERTLFGQHRPDAITAFHRINRQDFYPISINRDILRRAFFSEYGLSDFISGLMDVPSTSDNVDEFNIMTRLFTEFETNGGFFRKQIADITTLDSDETSAKKVLRQLRADAKTLGFVSTHYNSAGLPSFATPENLILIATPEFQAAIDVEALAAAFNVSYAEIPFRIITFPQEAMPGGVQAILTSEDIFMVRDTLLESTSQENVVGLHTNYFLHHHGVYSLSRFVPAIAYVLDNPTVITLDNTPVTGVSTLVLLDEDGNAITKLERGRNFIAQATATTTGVNDAVEFAITGSDSNGRTRIGQSGIGTVDEREEATSLTITWTALDNRSFVGTQTFNVVGTNYQEWPNPDVDEDADKDGLFEVVPDALTVNDNDDVIIPTVEGVQYKKADTDVANGSVQHITASTVFTAVAKTGYELASGATATWTLAP